MLTHKAKYALQALRVLAEAPQAPGSRPLPIHEIAERAHAPRKFLEAILLDLRRHGFVDSARGKAGGYALARPAAAIPLSEVVRAMDGPLAPLHCASLTAYRPCSDCADPAACAIRRVMREVRDAIAAILDRRTVADLAGESRETVMGAAGADATERA